MGLALSRRRFVVSVGAGLGAVGLGPLPELRAAPKVELPPMPIVPRVAFTAASRDASKKPAIDADFFQEQLDNATALFGPFGVRFASAKARDLDPEYLEIETRADRNNLAKELAPSVINVFFVASLRDVDKPVLYRMGVTWRNLQNLAQKYVIVAQTARPTTMAHELGHYFGLDHTSVKNNLMSYDRDGGTVFLDEKQGRTIRQHAEAAYRTKTLVPLAETSSGP